MTSSLSVILRIRTLCPLQRGKIPEFKEYDTKPYPVMRLQFWSPGTIEYSLVAITTRSYLIQSQPGSNGNKVVLHVP